MSSTPSTPLKLQAVVHDTLTDRGYPFSGLLMRGSTHVGFANGWLNIALDALRCPVSW